MLIRFKTELVWRKRTAFEIMLRKYYTEITFSIPRVEQGRQQIGGKVFSSLFVSENEYIEQVFRGYINLQKLPSKNDFVCLLPDEAVQKILLEGEGGERFETERQIKAAFTFWPVRHRGWIKPGTREYVRNGVWVGFESESYLADDSLGEEIIKEDNLFVITQLVRFGILDKFVPPNEG